MDSYTPLSFLHQSRVPYTISYTKQSTRRRSDAHDYVLLVPRNPLQGSRLRRTTTCHGSTLNGEGVSRLQTLTHFSERLRTIFPKSSANTPPHTPPQDCGRPRTLANNPELGHLDAICSSIHVMTSCSLQTTEREPS